MWPYLPELMSRPVPRYTSYPPATAFSDSVGERDQLEALNAVRSGDHVSLYAHIPYCRSICWYCGCNTGAASKAHRLTSYLEALEHEITLVAKILGGRAKISRIAFGGGSPNAIDPLAFVRLVDRMTTMFSAGAPEISVEIDPRAFTLEWAMTLAVAQVSRVSFGVQSFDPGIQAAIGRIQPVDMIETCMNALRARGVRGINFDLMYGLPTQTIASLDSTLDDVVRLRPNRIALFGYAHLPSMFPRQRRIDTAALPDNKARFEQAAHGYERLVAEGYRPIGFDHFALPDDPMAIAADKGLVRRNFQGFTDDPAETVIGMGASAISMFPHLIIQNEKNAGVYRDQCSQSRLSGNRGIHRCKGDQQRAKIIENLLCSGRASIGQGWPKQVQQALSDYQQMGLVNMAEGEIAISDDALPYARHVAAVFDEKLALAKSY